MPAQLSDKDPNNYMRYSLGVTAVVIAVTCVAAANALSVMAQNGSLPVLAFAPAKPALVAQNGKGPKFDNVDSTPTGSLRTYFDQPVILDPCTGRQK